MNRLQAVTIDRVSAFVRILEDQFDNDSVLFRGQRSDWPLRPKIARLRGRFAKNDITQIERQMLETVKLQSLPYLDVYPKTDWDWLAIAQHHGMATRLLDWTTNPLAALWFAVEAPANMTCAAEGERRAGVVWALELAKDDFVLTPESSSPFDGDRTRFFQPRHVARRIAAQSGWFSVHKYLAKSRGFVPLEKNTRYRSRLVKFVVSPDKFSNLRWELDRCGINAMSMLADLGGLCRHIEWCHSLAEDEGEAGPAPAIKLAAARVGRKKLRRPLVRRKPRYT